MTVARGHKGAARPTTLNAPINNTAMSFTVTAGGGTGYPDGSTGAFVIVLDATLASEEKVLCSARSTDTFTVAGSGRGYDDTVASSHANLASVAHVYAAVEAQEANDHIVATSAVHGVSGAVVGTTSVQTLTNKTLTTPTIGSFVNAGHTHADAANGGPLADEEAWRPVGGGGQPAFSGGVANAGAGFQDLQFKKVGNAIRIRGVVNGGAGKVPVFVLPAGYRPPAVIDIPLISEITSTTSIYGQVLTDGTVYYNHSTGAYVAFCCTFWID